MPLDETSVAGHRRWYKRNEEFLTFGEWSKTKGKAYYILAIEFTEDQMVEALVAIAREHLGPFVTIIDRKTNKLL